MHKNVWVTFSYATIILISFLSSKYFCQGVDSTNQQINFHFQQTVIQQFHPQYPSLYSGENSLSSSKETAASITSTLFLGVKLFDGAELYFNPELSGGSGFSSTTGVAGFPNGEVYRVDDPEPKISVARFFIRKHFLLNDEQQRIEDGANQLASVQSSKRMTVTLGKFSVSDIFDNNSLAHDPRSQFMNWSLMSSAAWDYPADTRGYTEGIAVEYIHPGFALRTALVMVPTTANGMTMDTNVKDAVGFVFEYEKSFTLNNQKGKTHLLFFYNRAHMGNYRETINDPTASMDLTNSRKSYHDKIGFAINTEYSLTDNIGTFLKLSWNDGKNETWMFTEIDHSLSLGAVIKNLCVIKKDDELGCGISINGISNDHKNFLNDGGFGFIIGDGKLNYGLENIFEIYFKTQLFQNLFITPDYQLVINPAYNGDRGPVNIFGVRAHVEF